MFGCRILFPYTLPALAVPRGQGLCSGTGRSKLQVPESRAERQEFKFAFKRDVPNPRGQNYDLSVP